MNEYEQFLENKKHTSIDFGIKPIFIPENMFDYQKFICEKMINKGRHAGFIDTGLGKTLIEIVTATNYVRSLNERCLIITPLAVAFQFIKEAEKFGIDDIEYSKDGKFTKKIVVCNYERLNKFNHSDFECVILDECFAPDTKIKVISNNKLQEKDIKDCIVGEKVLNCTGLDTIKEVKTKKVDYAIKIGFNGKEIISSPKHPYFTQRGWVPAKEIQKTDFIISTDKSMRILRKGFSNNIQIGHKETILRDIMLSEMANESTGNIGKSSYERSSFENREENFNMETFGERICNQSTKNDNGIESDAKYGNKSEMFSHIEGDGTQTFSAWGKWSWDDIASAIDKGYSVRRLDSGICYITGKTSKRISDKLQSRLSELKSKNCNRSGWELSLFEKGIRQKEGRKTGLFGVESFEVLEQTDSRLDKYRDESGSLYFYDLAIERHPSFTINECLVHNSSILKNFNGAIKEQITIFVRKVKYRYLFTATPSPNDYIELGTSSEALGYLGYTDMLTRFFANNENNIRPQDIGNKFYLKPHAKDNFFNWVRSWSVSMRKPSDLGFDDTKFILPELNINQHQVKNDKNWVENGQILMFGKIAKRLSEVREEQKMTIENRCNKAVELANTHDTSVYWCNFNDEGDLLNTLDKNAYQIKGSMDIDKKEELLLAFAKGEIKKLITKPSITCFGLNWQHCNHTVYFPTFSYEQYYQAIRRFWRFGQKREVTCDMVFSDGQKRVIDTLFVKSDKAQELFSELSLNVNSDYKIKTREFNKEVILPKFLNK